MCRRCPIIHTFQWQSNVFKFVPLPHCCIVLSFALGIVLFPNIYEKYVLLDVKQSIINQPYPSPLQFQVFQTFLVAKSMQFNTC